MRARILNSAPGYSLHWRLGRVQFQMPHSISLDENPVIALWRVQDSKQQQAQSCNMHQS